jgi:IclR family mhp operon transcriptional activator
MSRIETNAMPSRPSKIAPRPAKKNTEPGRGEALKDNVRALTRGLTVLRAANALNGASINQLAAYTGFSRGTTYRLVKTLEQEGYLAHDPHANLFAPTVLTTGLASNYRLEDWASSIVMPILQAATDRVKWPVGLSTLVGTSLVVRASTDRTSPFALRRYSLGHRVTLFNTAAGRVFLAFCPPDVRDMLVMLRKREGAEAKHAELAGADLSRTLERVRRAGHAVSAYAVEGERAIAVPVFVNGALFATLSLRYMQALLSADDARADYLPLLQAVSEELRGALESHFAGIANPTEGKART